MVTTVVRPRADLRDRASAARVFHALSDETRLAVLEMLRGGERCVCELQGEVGAAQSRLSFHLKVLKDAGLVTDRKEGRWSYYALSLERLAEATAALGRFTAPGPAGATPVKLCALERASGAAGGSGRTARAPRVQRNRVVARNGDDCC